MANHPTITTRRRRATSQNQGDIADVDGSFPVRGNVTVVRLRLGQVVDRGAADVDGREVLLHPRGDLAGAARHVAAAGRSVHLR